MQAHGDERLEVVGHRRLLDPQQLLGQRGLEVGGDAQRDLRPAEEHRPVDREVAVVRVVERVEPDPALARDVLLVDLDRAQVRLERALVVAAQHVDVRRHVHEVAGVGDERAQLVGDRQRLLGERRHLHQVHVEVHESGVRAAAGPLERALEHLLGLERRRTLGRQARVAIPQRPRREVHQRVGEERRDVELVGMRAIHVTHRLGVVSVPRDEVGRRVVDLVAAPERLDERPLDRRGAVRARARRRDLVARLLERRREVDRVERLPLLVVVRPDRVGDTPVGQREAGVVLERALEAPDRLLVVERVGPHQSAVEPRLGARRGRRRPARVGAEIEVGLHRCRSRPGLSYVSTASGAQLQRGGGHHGRAGRRPRLPLSTEPLDRVKRSGIGHEGLEEFLEIKYVTVSL